jgi:hypothetical protein
MPTHTKPPPADTNRRASRLKGWYMERDVVAVSFVISRTLVASMRKRS